ncbi:acyl-CoA N-acyltransferase [Mycena maculata]|uniref:Acyl-CoA N-acyltransferase n=1 Tax=Mycena maculata TaxID=230809 RepID=A0AAD7HJI9_9AGAR|nr:acyl-CoA N-acyltransferase [Mycena maculata]
MSSPLDKKLRLQPFISQLSSEDADAAATVQVRAMGSHAVQLRIQPLDKRPPFPAQVAIKAQGLRNMLSQGYHRIVKAVVDGEIVGIADWILISGKKAQVEEGVTPAPPKEHTGQDEETLKGVDVKMRGLVGKTSADMRNKTMEDTEYWYLSLMVVDPAYQHRGIGQALLQWGLDQADAQSSEVYLESSDDGLQLYEKNGFELVGWNVLADEKSEGGSLKWPAMKRRSIRS